MQTPAIRAQGLGRRYGRRWALAHLDLTVDRGECFLVVGANGSGKTTLLRLLATLSAPSVGNLEILGTDVATGSRQAAWNGRRRSALLSHRLGIYEDLSAAENLRILAGLTGREPKLDEWLQAVGLERRPDPVRNYSAGMRKRLGFARLLAQDPDLALIDEPYGQLDPEGFALTERIIDQLRERGTTLVIASHLVERAAAYCDRALLLNSGLPRWLGPAADITRAWSALHHRESA